MARNNYAGMVLRGAEQAIDRGDYAHAEKRLKQLRRDPALSSKWWPQIDALLRKVKVQRLVHSVRKHPVRKNFRLPFGKKGTKYEDSEVYKILVNRGTPHDLAREVVELGRQRLRGSIFQEVRGGDQSAYGVLRDAGMDITSADGLAPQLWMMRPNHHLTNSQDRRAYAERVLMQIALTLHQLEHEYMQATHGAPARDPAVAYELYQAAEKAATALQALKNQRN